MTTIATFTPADGAWIFGAVVVVWLLAIIYGYYTRRGSTINQRTYSRSDTPGAKIPSVLSHDQSAAERLLGRDRSAAPDDPGGSAPRRRRRGGSARVARSASPETKRRGAKRN
jgi:hypothetical protein